MTHDYDWRKIYAQEQLTAAPVAELDTPTLPALPTRDYKIDKLERDKTRIWLETNKNVINFDAGTKQQNHTSHTRINDSRHGSVNYNATHRAYRNVPKRSYAEEFAEMQTAPPPDWCVDRSDELPTKIVVMACLAIHK